MSLLTEALQDLGQIPAPTNTPQKPFHARFRWPIAIALSLLLAVNVWFIIQSNSQQNTTGQRAVVSAPKGTIEFASTQIPNLAAGDLTTPILPASIAPEPSLDSEELQAMAEPSTEQLAESAQAIQPTEQMSLINHESLVGENLTDSQSSATNAIPANTADTHQTANASPAPIKPSLQELVNQGQFIEAYLWIESAKTLTVETRAQFLVLIEHFMTTQQQDRLDYLLGRLNQAAIPIALDAAKIALNKYGEAAAIDLLAQYHNQHEPALAMYAGLLQKTKQFTQAELQYKALLTNNPGQSLYWLGLALALDGQQKILPATKAYKQSRVIGGHKAQVAQFIDQRVQTLTENFSRTQGSISW